MPLAREPAIVVGVNADANVQFARERGDARDLARQTATVGIAENNAFSPGFFRRLPSGQSVVSFIFEAVEAMLGIINHAFAVISEKADRVADHREVLLRLGPQHFGDMKQPGLADDRHHGSLRFENLTHQFVLLDGAALAPGHAESGDLGVFPLSFAGLPEELHIFWVGADSHLDEMDSEIIQSLAIRSLSVAEKVIPSPWLPSRRVVSYISTSGFIEALTRNGISLPEVDCKAKTRSNSLPFALDLRF